MGVRFVVNNLAAHVSLKLMDRGRLRPANDVECHRLVGLAAKAFNLEIGITTVEGVTEGRGGLRRPLETPNIRWLHATQARWSATLRASAACSAECRTDAP
jgi:hypothetical protein